MLTDVERLIMWIMRLSKNEAFRVWGSFGTFALVAFWMFSSGDFSFLLTLSSLVSVFSFLMVALTIKSTSTVSGVSVKMMECYLLVFFCRLCSIIPYEGYLPYDKSGDWFYQTCEALGLVLAGVNVYFCRVSHVSTYDPNSDQFNHWWIAGPAAAIALILHPHLNKNLFTDISWAFALYLESVAVLPQFFMFMKEGRAQAHTSHFLAAQALSRLLSFIFWASSFSEISNPDHLVKRFVGNWVVGIQMLQLLVMCDFIYHYIRAIQKGVPISEVLAYSTNV